MFARMLVVVVLMLCVAPASADDLVVTEWLALGTIPFDKDADPFDTPPPPGLLDAAPVAGDTFDEMTWQEAAATDNGHVSLLNRGWEREEIVTAYLLTYVHSNAEGLYTVSVGSDDGIQAFSNGTEVHRNWTRRGWDPDQDRFTVRLQIGWNRLLLRVANYYGGFGASAVILRAGTMSAGATPPSGFRPAEIAPYVVFGPTRLDPGLVADEAGKLAVSAVTTVRNLGTAVAEPVRLRVTADNATVGLSAECSLAPGPSDIPIRLDPEMAARSVAAGTDLRLHLEWGGKMGETRVDAGPQDLLRIVSGDPPLREGLPVSSTDMARLLDNWSWGARFRPDLFADETDLRALLINYVYPDDEAFRAAWITASGRISRAAEAIKQQRITFVGNAHIDMAWLWNRAETIEVVDMTFDQALKFMDEFPFFNYAQSQMQAYAWTEELFPEMMQRLDAAVQAGRWIPVGGMWVEPDCNLPSGESFVRQLLYGKGWIRDRYGIDIRVGWNPDSFGYAWTLPMIFKGAGIDYFITQKIGWNDTTEFPHRLFWWQAPDGSRVLGYFPFTYTDDARPERMAERLAHQQEQQPGLVDMLNLYGVGDHGGGPTREMIERYVAMSELEGFPAVEHATPLSFMERAEKKYREQIPVWDDELYLEYHRGTFTSQAEMKLRNRRMESALEAAEKLAAMADALVDSYEYPDEHLDGAWLRTLFNQFHDILPGSSIPEVFEDARADYAEAEALVSVALHGALDSLEAQITTNEREGVPVVVFNPLSWARSEVVGVPLMDLRLYPESLKVVDAHGTVLPSQMSGDHLLFLAENVPGIGYRTFWVNKRPKSVAKTALRADRTEDRFVVKNEAVRAEIDARSGDLRSLIMLHSGWEMLGREGGNVLQLFGDVPSQWDAWNIGYTGEEWGVTAPAEVRVVENGPVRAIVRATRKIGASELIQDYVVSASSPLLEIRTHATWDESHKMLKTAFQFAGDPQTATFEIPYGTIGRTTLPETEAEKAKWEVPGQRWVDVTDKSGEFGLTLVNDSKYGYAAVGSTLRLTLLRAPKYPDPNADIGEHEFAYALYPHDGDWRQADSYRRGAEYNVPLIVRVTKRHEGDLPSERRLIGTDARHVVLSAFKAAQDTEARPAFVLRVNEVEGKSGSVKLSFPFPIAQAWAANLMEDRQDALTVDGSTVTLPIGPYELKSVVVQPAP